MQWRNLVEIPVYTVLVPEIKIVTTWVTVMEKDTMIKEYFSYSVGCAMASREMTPESLRAAAIVLEDKAKELEKPKFTGRQQAFLDGLYSSFSPEVCFTSKDGKRGWWGLATSKEEVKKCLANAEMGWRITDETTCYLPYGGERIPMLSSRTTKTLRIDWNRL